MSANSSKPDCLCHLPAATVNGFYRRLPLQVLWAPTFGRGHAQLLRAWLLSLAACLCLGMFAVLNGWHQLRLGSGSGAVMFSVYPPLTLFTLWALWFGYGWGAIMAFLTGVLVACGAGLPLGWGVLSALSNPLGLLVLTTVYRNVRISYVPSSLSSLLFLAFSTFLAAIASACGSFIWSLAGGLPVREVFAVWEGWWSGYFIQTLLTCGPLLWLTPCVMRWRDRHWTLAATPPSGRRFMMAMVLLSVGGVLALLWLSFFLADHAMVGSWQGEANIWRERAMLYRDSAMVMYWVLSVLLVALVFLGYRFFTQRTLQLRQAAQRVTFERDFALQRQMEVEVAHSELQHLNQQLAARVTEVEALQQRLQEQALRDPLTGLYNRRYLHAQLPLAWRQAGQRQQPLTMAMIDLDHFKRINDQYGHAAGDAVLCALARLFEQHLPAGSFAVRYGGEEFCLVLPGLMPVEVWAWLSAVQAAYADCEVRSGVHRLRGLTFSAGIAARRPDIADEEALLREADAALYQAKAAGRNCLHHAV